MALTDNLVSYYKLEGNSTDSVGSNNGTDTTITYSHANGKVLQGAGFGGASKIALGSSSTLNPTAITYSAWVKASSFANAYNAVIARSAGVLFCALLIKSTGKLAPYISATGTVAYDGTGSNTLAADGTWYHLAMTYSSTDGLKAYVNASLDGSAAANGNIQTIAGTTYIGEDVVFTPRFWNGAIDEVGIWSRVLTPAEITQLYNYGAGLTYPFTSSSFLAFM